jgi:hypothetical protein
MESRDIGEPKVSIPLLPIPHTPSHPPPSYIKNLEGERGQTFVVMLGGADFAASSLSNTPIPPPRYLIYSLPHMYGMCTCPHGSYTEVFISSI